MIELSVLIPARQEDMLDRTLQDLMENIEADTEVIVVLDGWTPEPSLKTQDNRITLIYNPEPKGQRAATNQAAKLAKGKYVMKSDAHVAFDKGFDRKMLDGFKELGDNVTMIPVLKNLWAYDWVCENGHRRYQGKVLAGCPECNAKEHQDIHWTVKPHGRFTFTFDKTMHFQYDGAQAKKPESLAQGQYRETMSIQGSCFMLTKERYFALDICSEEFHSWGQQGVEVACKTWLSGGRVISNLNTWYAHMFRTNNFGGFPYHNPEDKIDENRELSRELFQRNKWPLAIHSFQWLLDRFKPTVYWHGEPSKGIIYYTDSELPDKIALPVRQRLQEISEKKGLTITSASLKKLDFGKNVHFPSLKRGFYTMFTQILSALEHSTADIVFFTEHDVLYDSSHFDFTPLMKDTFYYNQNVWFLRQDGHAMHYDVNQLSGLCVYRETAIIHFKERLKRLETEEFTRNMGFEPFTHNRMQWENEFHLGTWKSANPNIDIRFGVNSTGMRWTKEEYRNQQLLINWQETEMPELVKLFA